MNCTHDKLTVNVLPVQQQSNGVDYDVFYLSYCNYKNKTRQYIIPEMRVHMLHCIKAIKYSSFPQLLDCKRCIQKDIFIAVVECNGILWKIESKGSKWRSLAEMNSDSTECANAYRILSFLKKTVDHHGIVIVVHKKVSEYSIKYCTK